MEEERVERSKERGNGGRVIGRRGSMEESGVGAQAHWCERQDTLQQCHMGYSYGFALVSGARDTAWVAHHSIAN